MSGTRAVVALYVALALHVLAALLLLLMPGAQNGKGEGAGLGVGLRLEGSDSVLAPLAPSPRSAPPIRATLPRATVPNAHRVARRSVDAGPGEAKASEEFIAVDAAQSANSGSPVGTVRGAGVDRYFARLRQHLYRFRRELPGGLRAARATIGFTVSPGGELLDLRLVESSGVAELDAEALDLMRRAVPLPGPPDGAAVQLVVPIEIES